MQQQQQQQQPPPQSVLDSCLAFSHSFPANVIWAEERFVALANVYYKERKKRNSLHIVFGWRTPERKFERVSFTFNDYRKET